MFQLRAISHNRYFGPILLTASATLLTFLIQPLFGGRAPLFLYLIAVMLSAYYSGVRPGLLTTALSVASATFCFRNSLFMPVMAYSSIVLFSVLAVFMTVLFGRIRRTNLLLLEAKRELEEANRKLSLRSANLARSNEELQRFAYSIAHDLHNPLRSMSALTDLLVHRNAQKFDQSSKECARMIVDSCTRMSAMIKGLLDYASTAEDESIESPRTDCNIVLKRVLADLHYMVETTGAVVTADPLPVVPIPAEHMVKILSNLISNGIKYRSQRCPEVHVSASEQGGEWVFTVRDNGIGFDMQHADDIFAMFKRLHSAEEYEGNGIGLALCKMVIERQGGRIWAQSTPGEGSRFEFSLPKKRLVQADSDVSASR